MDSSYRMQRIMCVCVKQKLTLTMLLYVDKSEVAY